MAYEAPLQSLIVNSMGVASQWLSEAISGRKINFVIYFVKFKRKHNRQGQLL